MSREAARIKVSMIIPVYNAEQYLRETLECVRTQSLNEIEVILINDGSQDGSGQICDEYQRKDPRFTVIHQENKGMCAARNLGISLAKGEYIAFGDNDDVISVDFLEKNYLVAKRKDADIVKYGRKTIYVNADNKVVGEEIRAFQPSSYEGKELKENYFVLQRIGALTSVWDGLYRKEAVLKSGIRFHEQFRYGNEDTLFCRELIPHIQKLVLNEGCYYFHYIRYNYSASAKFNNAALDRYRVACGLEEKVWEQLGIDRDQSGEKELAIMKDYLIPILFMLCDKKCDYSYKKKKQYLNKIYDSKGFQMNLTKTKVNKIMRLNKKQGVLLWLFEKRLYIIVLIIAKQYKRIIANRLNKRLHDQEKS